MFTADKRHGVLSLAVSKRSEDRSYEGFVDEFMDWWVQETQAHRLKQENEKKESSSKKMDQDARAQAFPHSIADG